MDNWISYLVELNFYLLIIGLSYHLGFKKSQNFKFGRPYLLLGTIGSFLFPFFKHEKIAVASNSIIKETLLLDPISVAPIQEVSINFQLIILFIMSLGFVVQIAKTIKGFIQLSQLKATSQKNEYFYILPSSTKAFSFLGSIFLGEQIPDTKKEIIYQHELIHSRKNHSLDVLFMQIVKAVTWYNPIVYLSDSNLKELHEFEADYLCTTEEAKYVDLLLQQNFQNYEHSFTHQFNSNHLKNRIMRIQRKTNHKISRIVLLASLTLIIGSIAISQNTPLIKKDQILDLSDLSLFNNLSDINRLDQLKKSTTLPQVNTKDKQAEYPGGQKALSAYIIKNTKYPKNLINNEIKGTVYISFKVNVDGTISEIKAKNKVHPELEKLATATIKNMTNWEPAVKDGKKVASTLTLPIKFLPPPPPAPSSPPTPPAPKTSK